MRKKTKTPKEYIVILSQVITNREGRFEIAYLWDGWRFSTPLEARRHGFQVRESDDFNIGVLKNDKVIELRWMDKVFLPDQVDLEEINDGLGL